MDGDVSEVGVDGDEDSSRGEREAAALFWFLAARSAASNPVPCIMDPSRRERMNVDWTPGREVRWERRAVTCWGT